jgi:hypothetical protein
LTNLLLLFIGWFKKRELTYVEVMKKLLLPLLVVSTAVFADINPAAKLVARNTTQNTYDDQKIPCGTYVNPLTAQKGNVFFEAEYIYWKPVAKIPYAVVSDQYQQPDTAGTLFSITTNRTIERVNLKAKSGFKVGFGIYLPPEGWMTSGEYTWIKGTNRSTSYGEPVNTLTNAASTKTLDAVWRTEGIGDNSGTIERLTSASAKQHFSYQVFDWVLQNTIYWKKRFTFTPYFGVRGAWITNQLDVTYLGIDQGASATVNVSDIARVQSNYRAWGIRGGFRGIWVLGYGLEIFGNASMSLVYGKHDIRQRENALALSATSPADAFLNFSTTSANDWYALREAFQLALGMEWGRHFSCDKVYFGLKVGYEANIWPDVIQLRKLQKQRNFAGSDALGTPANEPLLDFNRTFALHGLTVGARLDF